jgi:hypothetical protein
MGVDDAEDKEADNVFG